MMKATGNGIEWARIRDEDLDGVIEAVDRFAKGCNLDHQTGFGTPYGESHYTTIGGETICPGSAIAGLQQANRGADRYGYQAAHMATIRAAFKNAHAKSPKVTDFLVAEELAAA